jgi:hypothetical protein
MIPKHNMWDGLPNAFKVKKRWGKTLREASLAKDLKQGGQSSDLQGWGGQPGRVCRLDQGGAGKSKPEIIYEFHIFRSQQKEV